MANQHSAAQAGYILCNTCHLLCKKSQHTQQHPERCPRCLSTVYRRKPASLSRTWALTLAAMILYIPANLYPMMTVTYLGRSEPDTIMSGIIVLAKSGMLPIALVVFIASVAVPILKLIGICVLLLSVQFKWPMSKSQRTLMYRIIELIGRWSMLDLFVIAILVALVNFGNLSDIETGGAATAFGAVVVLTMLAAKSFDPRLIWDQMENPTDTVNHKEV